MQRVYSTKRDLKVILDTAQCVGLRVIAWVPLYYLDCRGGCGCNNKWPLCADLVRQWAKAFKSHPALGGWIISDEMSAGDISKHEEGHKVRTWVHEGETPAWHPTISIVNAKMFMDPSGELPSDPPCPPPPWPLGRLTTMSNALFQWAQRAIDTADVLAPNFQLCAWRSPGPIDFTEMVGKAIAEEATGYIAYRDYVSEDLNGNSCEFDGHEFDLLDQESRDAFDAQPQNAGRINQLWDQLPYINEGFRVVSRKIAKGRPDKNDTRGFLFGIDDGPSAKANVSDTYVAELYSNAQPRGGPLESHLPSPFAAARLPSSAQRSCQ
ncbi:MAG: hypothetical protein CME06_13420 [Gemmatimonadetes bacterium]|nr:hypothetical protein [Gemmatimonadota bacterium]